jgi:hypothetical protein
MGDIPGTNGGDSSTVLDETTGDVAGVQSSKCIKNTRKKKINTIEIRFYNEDE